MAPPRHRPAPRAALVGAVCVVVLTVLSVLVATRWGPLVRVDRQVVRAAHPATRDHTWLFDAARQVTQLGSWLALDLIAAAMAFAAATRRRWDVAGLVLVVRGGELALENLMKVAIHRPRPSFADPLATAHGFSFPSGHAAGAAAMFGLVAVLAVRRSGAVPRVVAALALGTVVAAVAASRVLLGVHYPSDVAAGVLVGGGWLAVCLQLFAGSGGR